MAGFFVNTYELEGRKSQSDDVNTMGIYPVRRALICK